MSNIEKSFDLLEKYIHGALGGLDERGHQREALQALGLIKGFLLGLSMQHEDNPVCVEFLAAATYFKEPAE